MSKGVSRVFILRHGERVDFTFGKSWCDSAFDDQGKYSRSDLNMPKELPKRKIIQGWRTDSPLTNIGIHQAKLIGEAMRSNGIQIDRAYSSPSFRCVTTCASTLEGLGQKDTVPINVEPGVFEYCMWHKRDGHKSFDWLTVDELSRGGFNVNSSYKPVFTQKDIDESIDESFQDFRDRNGKAMEEIVKGEGGIILIVAHAATLEVGHQKLCQTPLLSQSETMQTMLNVTYCSLIGLERDLSKGTDWLPIQEGNYSLTHTANKGFRKNVIFKGTDGDSPQKCIL